jgi:DNA helicase-2/ATP-dependent DNA helicase PcrA
MGFFADLHIHSKFSRATSRDLDLTHMALWARRKGVSVVGTGDFTHPGWFREIEEKLVPAEPGLFRLRPELERAVEEGLGSVPGCAPGSASGFRPATPAAVRFLLEVEISTIYKRADRTRKVHHLVYAPDLEAARKLAGNLARIGNIASDGRPILGLDSRDLLEIALSSGEGSYLVPAHIWTPWFAVLGSSSGFDSLGECYGDLASHIFAVETGLSSDPPMNRRLSALDRYRLVSNSDAHSPAKIAREACAFECDLDYFAMRRALETGEGYAGTVEFFPEEGKYHYDGHRKCGVCLSPEESRKREGICPECGKPLTLGVMSRVDRLADRPEGEALKDGTPHRSFIPLAEVIAEVEGTGPGSKSVERAYGDLIRRVGAELFVLERAPLEDIGRVASGTVAEAISRMREGRVIREPGYDGEYGRIRLFEKDELSRRGCGSFLMDALGLGEPAASPRAPASRPSGEDRTEAVPPPPGGTGSVPSVRIPASAGGTGSVPSMRGAQLEGRAPSRPAGKDRTEPVPPGRFPLLDPLDPEQRVAALATDGPLAILAGPGTGKTRTLTYRMAHLVLDLEVPPEVSLAVTFTRRAAAEMAERLETLLGPRAGRVPVHTFHSLALGILREHGFRLGLPAPRVAGEAERRGLLSEALGLPRRAARRLLREISRRKRGSAPRETGAETALALEAYERALRARGLLDFDDLVLLSVRLLQEHADVAKGVRDRYRSISVDEAQDMDPLQYRLVRLLAPPDGNVCIIGDPDQSIYGFRGADAGCFRRFLEDFPGARTVSLSRNYRSARPIVEGALQAIAPESLVPGRRLEAGSDGVDPVEIHDCATERAEAELVVHTIEKLLGGSSFFSVDSGRSEGHGGGGLSFGDFAVLYRTNAQAGPLVEAFARSGMPFQRRSHAPLTEAPGVEAFLRSMEAFRPAAPERRSVAGLLERAATELGEGAAGLPESLGPLRALAARHGENFEGFVSDLALGVDSDLWDPRAEAVSLLTLHAAKGLEFPVVFIVGCEDGILPLRWAGDHGEEPGEGREDERTEVEEQGDGVAASKAEAAEERRLFFVGMTRARRRLFLLRARRRLWRGSMRPMKASPFLGAIEERLLTLHRHAREAVEGPRFRQLELFDAP